MERIIIEVNDEVAKKWRYTSKSNKSILSKSFAKTIENAFSDKNNFWEFVENANESAVKKGFDDEKLKEILVGN